MNYLDYQNELMILRFGSQARDHTKKWLNISYTKIWNAGDWLFKRPAPIDLPVVAGDLTPAMPQDFGSVSDIYTDGGGRLSYLNQQDYEATQFGSNGTSGKPSGFAVFDRQVWLTPTPSGSYTFKLAYRRRLAKVNEFGVVAAGVLENDLDQALWPAEYDYLLILDAMILGLQMTNDPTWAELTGQRDELLQQMQEDLTPEHQYARLQYGKVASG